MSRDEPTIVVMAGFLTLGVAAYIYLHHDGTQDPTVASKQGRMMPTERTAAPKRSTALAQCHGTRVARPKHARAYRLAIK
jgi:hypothetical protein